MADHPGTPFPHYGEEQAAKRRLRRFTRAFLWFTFLLYAIPISGWFVVDAVAERRLQRTFRMLEKAGYSTEPKWITYAPTPSLDNGAVLYDAACGILRSADLEIALIGDGFWERFSAEEQRQAWDVLERYREAFDLARRARLKPYCRFDVEEDGGFRKRGWWPRYAEFSCLGMALSLRAQGQAAEGRQEEARETLRDLWGLVLAVREEPVDTTQAFLRVLVPTAVEATVRCSRSSRTASDWQQWQDLLPDPDSFRAAMFLELRGDLDVWIRDARKGHRLAAVSIWGKSLPDRAVGYVLRPVLKFASAKGLGRLQNSLDRWQQSPASLRDELTRCEDRILDKASCVYLKSGGPRETIRHLTILQSAIAVARAGMDCERIWMLEGKYPETLTEADPMTGRALEVSLDGTSLSSRPPRGRVTISHNPEQDGLVWNLLHVGD